MGRCLPPGIVEALLNQLSFKEGKGLEEISINFPGLNQCTVDYRLHRLERYGLVEEELVPWGGKRFRSKWRRVKEMAP